LDDGLFDTLGIQSVEVLLRISLFARSDIWEYWERRAVPAKQKKTSSNEKTKSQKYTNKQQNKKTKS